MIKQPLIGFKDFRFVDDPSHIGDFAKPKPV